MICHFFKIDGKRLIDSGDQASPLGRPQLESYLVGNVVENFRSSETISSSDTNN